MLSEGCPSTSIHGTHVAYVDARCRCPEARKAVRDYERIRQREVRAGAPRRLVSSVGSARRLQALHAIGWPSAELCLRLGVARGVESAWTIGRREVMQRRVAERITALYLELHERPGPSLAAQTRAVNKGWLPPLRWLGKNMEILDTQPWRAGLEPDWAAVERIAAGSLPWRECSRIERRLAVQALSRRGYSVNAMARRLERCGSADPGANALRMVARDLAWLRDAGLVPRRSHGLQVERAS